MTYNTYLCNMEIELRPIPFRDHYKVSECGTRVISTITGTWATLQDNIVKGKVSGYKYVTLGHPTLKPIRTGVHRCVCWAFHGPPPAGKPWVNHKDGNKGNNHADNLEWSSISANIQHAYDTGLHKVVTGPDHWMHGKKASKDTKKLMSEAKLGVKHPKFKGFYVINGVRYPSAPIASRLLGVSVKVISYRCKNKPNQFWNWFFEPVERAKTPVNTE